MSDIKLEFLGQQPDLALTGHQITLATDDEAIAQQLRIRLKFFLGEFFLDVREGIPFFREVFKKNPNLQLLRSLFKQAIITTPGVVSVDELDLSINTRERRLEMNFAARIDTGETLVFSPFILEL